MLNQLVRTLVVASALLGLGATSASADTISVTAGPDPTEEVPVPLTVSWSGATNQGVFLTIKPAGPIGCGATYSIDSPNSEDLMWSRGNGAAAGTTAENHTLSTPGTYTLCAYLQTGSSATTASAVSGPVALVVRSARATVGIAAPPRVDVQQKFTFSLPVTTEIGRSLFVTIKPAGGRSCEASYSLDSPNSEDIVYSRNVQGAQTVAVEHTASSTLGTYLLCAYVQEGSSDLAPEATSSATFLVGPDPCVTARTALTTAQKRVKTAESAVKRNRTLWKRYDKRSKSARGARKASLRRQAKKYKSRYSTAVRTRSKERGKLATAQSGVAGACPAG